MAYLYISDYYRLVQKKYLDQVLNNDDAIRTGIEPVAEQELRGHLVQRYDIDFEMRALSVYNKSATYKYGERVYLDAAAYNNATSYVVDNLVLSAGIVYICIQNGSGNSPATSPAFWTALGAQYKIFSVVLPANTSIFDYDTAYNTGAQVWYKDSTYTAIKNTEQIYPDDPAQGSIYWSSGTAYAVTGQLPTNTTFYEARDSRNPQLVMYTTDIAMFHLDTRLNPNQIPDLRVARYDNAIAFLKSVAAGKVTLNLRVPTPETGNPVTWGSNPKLNLDY